MKHLLQLRHNLLKVHSRSGYIVLLPELPPTTETFNKINITAAHDKLPQFSHMTTEKCVTLMGQKIIEYETQLLAIEDKIPQEQEIIASEEKSKAKAGLKVFSKIFDSIEKLNTEFDNTWALLRHLYFTSKNTMPPNIFFGIHNRAKQARYTKFALKNVYESCKSLDATQLSEEQQRVLSKYMLESKLAGIELSVDQKDKLEECSHMLYHKQRLFQLKLDAALKAYNMPIHDLNILPDAPPQLIYDMSVDKRDVTQGPWVVNLQDPLKSQFLEYCTDRDRRRQMWHAEEKAASNLESRKELNTSVVLEDIRQYRHIKAQLLGYENYLHLSMETKMVGSLQHLEHVLEEIRIRARLAQDNEVENLQNFIENKHPIQIWDVPFYSRLQKKQLYGYDEAEWSNYFTLDTVLNTLFSLTSQLFDIQFEEKKEIDVWNKHVRYFNVLDKQSKVPLAGFYLDPFRNSQKLGMNQVLSLRTGSRINQVITPLSTLILNLSEPKYGKPCLVTFKQVEDVFYQFGSLLQRSLTSTHYSDVSGANNIEWDSVHVMSHFLTHWIYEEGVFNQLNAHFATGDKLNISGADLKRLRAHNAGIEVCAELFKANLDLQLHNGVKPFWMDISRELYPLHFGFPIEKYSNLPCRFVEVGSGDLAGGYYSFLWSRLVAADIYSAFKEEEEASTNQAEAVNQAVSVNQTVKSEDGGEVNVAARLRDTFLTFGGSCHSSEVFRRFRGRDPCYKPFLDVYQLD
uniref:Organellar oligopeptidase A, chloroplastic/mitochondrial n=2 Tax=Cacopsylla melanoneura TaxID=428564 RepID=A0A8D8V6F9_9HEMI